MNINEYMKRTGVSKKAYVLNWLKSGLIPGALYEDGLWYIPDAARRPHRPRLSPGSSADKIRTSMVMACIKRHHISAAAYSMAESEFNFMVQGLVEAGLIAVRRDQGIDYYDSTPKSDEYKNDRRKLEKYIRDFAKLSISLISPVLDIMAM